MAHVLNLALRKFVAPEFIFGQGSAELAGQYAGNLGASRVFVVTDKIVREQPWYGAIIDSLIRSGLYCDEFMEVTPNPRVAEVMAGALAYEASGADVIVAIGGGSVIDCAKGIGVVSANKRPITDFEGVDMIPVPGPPLVCVPTTSGSSADVSQFAIINDEARKVKIALVSKMLVPDVSLIDPALTVTMDIDLTVHTGLDALTHAFESYVSKASSPVTDMHALESVRRIVGYLLLAQSNPTDLTARGEVMLGSLFAGLAFSNAILGNVHAMAHSLGGFLDLPHGLCNAVLLDHVVAFNFDSAPKRYLDLAAAMGENIRQDLPQEQQKEAVVAAIRKMKHSLGVTASLRDLGVCSGDIPELATKAMHDACLLTNPRETCLADLTTIFNVAMGNYE